MHPRDHYEIAGLNDFCNFIFRREQRGLCGTNQHICTPQQKRRPEDGPEVF